jgi:hypothetical protein
MVSSFPFQRKVVCERISMSSPIDPNFFASLSFVYDEESVNDGRICQRNGFGYFLFLWHEVRTCSGSQPREYGSLILLVIR